MATAKLDTLINWEDESHRTKLRDFLKTLDLRSYWITIKPYRKSRSKEANAYYWVGVVAPICDFHGYNSKIQKDRDAIHEMLKKQFNSTIMEFNRPAFSFELGNGFEQYTEVTDYLDEKEWKPDIMDGKILLPLRVVRGIEERFEYGEEIMVTDYESLPNTTTKLDSAEHFEFIERVRDYYALEYNLYTAPPDQSKALSELD